MRTILSLLSVLAVCGYVFAADTTSASAAKPAPAPAPVAAPAAEPAPAPIAAPVAVAAEKPAAPAAKCAPSAPLFTWYGMAMFRVREEIKTNVGNGIDTESSALSYQIAYKLGVKAKPNDQTLIQLEIGNDWYATEEAEGIPGNYYTKRSPMTPWFDLAYAQWDPGYLHIQAGIIPVKGTPLMDLLGVSLLYNRSYKKAAHLPWGVVTNFSQTGLRLGAPIVNGPFSIGVDAMSAIIEQRPVAAPGVNTMKINASAIEYELEVPMSMQGLTLTPQAFVIPNRSFNRVTGNSDIEFGSGICANYKPMDGILFRMGYGYARNSNRTTARDNNGNPNFVSDVYSDPFNLAAKPDTVNKIGDSVVFDRWGNNVNIGTTIKLGPGNVDFDFNVSNEQNAYKKTVDDWYPFIDLKYGLMLSKNFILMPRVRLFFLDPKAGMDYGLTTRPEIIFTGSF